MSEGKKEILLGDCLELMKDIPNGSIDMILCDLPYGTTACKWDTIIPFDALWKEYQRLIKPNGAIVLFGAEPFSSVLRFSSSLYKYDWTWIKNIPSGFMLCKKQPMRVIENICVFYKLQPTYNPQLRDKPERDIKKLGNNVKVKQFNSEHYTVKEQGKHEYRTIPFDKSYPINALYYNNTHNNGFTIHPTQKPIELFEYLIRTYTNEGELILDNCAGSGTTAIACLNTKRQFIVMEKEQKYYDIILKRVGDFNKKFEPQTLFENEM